MLNRLKSELGGFENAVKGKSKYIDADEIELRSDALELTCTTIILEDMPNNINRKGPNDQEYITFILEQQKEVREKFDKILDALK